MPFPTWTYKPSYLPAPLAMHIGDAGIEEPMWVYMRFMQRGAREKHFTTHPAGVREISGLKLTSPAKLSSATAEAMLGNGVLSVHAGDEYLLEVGFDGDGRGFINDFRPSLPLVFRF